MPTHPCADSELAHRYVRSDLTEEEQAAFEAHYFECPRCTETVKTSWVLQAALKQVAAESPDDVPVARPAGHHAWRWGAVAAALAACAVAAVLLRQTSPDGAAPTAPLTREQTTPVAGGVQPEALMALARIEPPPYVSLPVRGDADRFEAAMAHYLRRDYETAAKDLRALAARRPREANVQFFLGVSELMAARPDAAIGALEAAALHGSREQADHARFLLGKAWLAKARAPEARRELDACVKLGGPHAREAHDLLKKF